MALPTILINATGGSDSAASGAGPATALTGSAGISAADGLSVLLDGSPDLSGVATDGSHVIYFADATAGNRNFGKITGTSGSGGPTATVTVANAFGSTLTKAWAIGGKRASIGSTTSSKLFSNNSGNGDALPGWIVEMESGHTETIAATYTLRRAGDTTTGPIILRGTSGAGTLPVVTFSNNGQAFNLGAASQILQDFEIRNSNATKTASEGVRMATATGTCRGLRIDNSTNKFWKGINVAANGVNIGSCLIGNCASHGIESSGQMQVLNNYIYSCAGNGINNSAVRCIIAGNVVYACTGDGMNTSGSMNDMRILHNTFDANGGDGFECSSATTSAVSGCLVNNIFSNNSGYGVNFSNGAQTDAALSGECHLFRGNNFFNNTVGPTNPSTISAMENGSTGNPTYTAASTFDHSIGTPLKAAGWPAGGSKYVGNYSTTYSYVDPGAAQRQEPSGGLLTQRGFTGGYPA